MNFECDRYDDFLGLSALDVSRYQLIVLSGISGSGKSSAMHYLSKQIENHSCQWVTGEPLPWTFKTNTTTERFVVDIDVK